jgi:hypothetical protein
MLPHPSAIPMCLMRGVVRGKLLKCGVATSVLAGGLAVGGAVAAVAVTSAVAGGAVASAAVATAVIARRRAMKRSRDPA